MKPKLSLIEKINKCQIYTLAYSNFYRSIRDGADVNQHYDEYVAKYYILFCS